MSLERRNPLPVGRYWIDVFEKDSGTWSTWHDANKSTVQVTTTEHHDANAGGPARDFFIFKVTAPTPWEPKLGFPTIAAGSVQTSDDTVQKPPPEKEPDLGDIIGKAVLGLGITVGLIVGMNLILQGHRRK